VRPRVHACAGDAPRSNFSYGARQLSTTNRSPGFNTEADAPAGYDPRGYWSAVAEQIRTRASGSLLAGDDSPFLRYKREAFLDRMPKRIAFRGKAVLEVGCGPGANLLEVAAAGPRRLVGCDIAPKMIELAMENTARMANVECVELADDGLPFRTNEFDVSFTVTVLQHNRDDTVRRLIAEMSRVTAEALYLIEDTTRRSRHLDRFVGRITGGTVRPESYVLRRVGDYAELCATRGFELVDVRPVNVYASDVMRVGVWFLDTRHPIIPAERGRELESVSGSCGGAAATDHESVGSQGDAGARPHRYEVSSTQRVVGATNADGWMRTRAHSCAARAHPSSFKSLSRRFLVQSGTSLSQGSRVAARGLDARRAALLTGSLEAAIPSIPPAARVPLPSWDAVVDKTLARYEEAMLARPRADRRTARPSRRPSVLGRT
jgi:SAM-dependent methyltransferase